MLVSSHSDRCDTEAPNTNAVAGSEVREMQSPDFPKVIAVPEPELVDDLSTHVLTFSGLGSVTSTANQRQKISQRE